MKTPPNEGSGVVIGYLLIERDGLSVVRRGNKSAVAFYHRWGQARKRVQPSQFIKTIYVSDEDPDT